MRPGADDHRRETDADRALTMATKTKAPKVVKAKTKCCKDKPRCKRCPVVLKKLEKAGHAKRVAPGRYVMIDVTAKALAAARARG